jgi:DNA uptake protein ComE-like DNA-binding protein
MSWRDYFYFSKGERMGLIVLLSLVVIAVTILFLNNKPELADRQTMSETPNNLTVTEALTPKETVPLDNNNADNKVVTPKDETVRKKETPSSQNTKESVPERVNRLTSYSQPTYTRAEKFAEGTVVELNTADTTVLKKIPGIGSAFAKRIVGYRALLGGYYSVTQLSEVYGIDEERYVALQPWFSADPSLVKKLHINTIPQDSLQRHPYISYAQAKVIVQLRRQKGKLTGWENLQLLNEFTESDKTRLQSYLSFD